MVRHAVDLDELLPFVPNDAGDVFLEFLFEVRLNQALPNGHSKDRLNREFYL